MTGAKELISSAFGISACLYKDVLQCKANATPSEMRKAYHKRALQFHPDKNKDHDATCKFQAISAAYELLLDTKKRALYDATGSIGESFLDEERKSSSSSNTDRWTEFFRSVFHDILTADSEFDRRIYCGSNQEIDDVIKFYNICKGDLFKVLTCIILSQKKDLARWIKDIIYPAIQNGKIEEYDAFVQTSREAVGETKKSKKTNLSTKKKINKMIAPVGAHDLADTDEEIDITGCSKKRKRIPSRLRTAHSSSTSGLVDTDDEEGSVTKADQYTSPRMSKRDKMEYRVARKQKEKKEREIQLAKLIKGKRWGTAAIPSKSRARSETLSSGFLSHLEKKFVDDDPPERKKSIKKIRKRNGK